MSLFPKKVEYPFKENLFYTPNPFKENLFYTPIENHHDTSSLQKCLIKVIVLMQHFFRSSPYTL